MMRVALCMFALIFGALPAAAADLDDVWGTIYQRLGGTFLGETYQPDKGTQRSLRWTCDSCGFDQQIRVGLYDYAYNYDTTDTDKVMRMVTGGCGFDDCKTRPYARDGLRGLRQTGTERGQQANRSAVFIADRMLLVEVRSARNAAETAKLQRAVETAILTEIAKTP